MCCRIQLQGPLPSEAQAEVLESLSKTLNDIEGVVKVMLKYLVEKNYICETNGTADVMKKCIETIPINYARFEMVRKINGVTMQCYTYERALRMASTTELLHQQVSFDNYPE